MVNLASSFFDEFFDCAKSRSSGILKASSRRDWIRPGKPGSVKGLNQDAAASFQGWQNNAVLDSRTRTLLQEAGMRLPWTRAIVGDLVALQAVQSKVAAPGR